MSAECNFRQKSRVNFSCMTSDKPGEKVCCRNGCLLTAMMPPLLLRLVLQDGINDSLVNKISNLYKQLTNPHDRAVFTGGMHTGASTRWGGIQELLDDQGNMCCPDCGCAEHPSLDHVLWRCPFYERFRNHPSPSCPLARRLGSNSNVTVSEPLDLISQMGKIRAAEVVLWHRVRFAVG